MTIAEEISVIKSKMGKKLLILAHYYQQAEVLKHADAIGDSLELARKAAAEKEADRIVFCGVHFMAESADLLTEDNQKIYMPDVDAGCPMADMVSEQDFRKALSYLIGNSNNWLPVVYVNSSAAVKAICGKYGGITCTSSNAPKVCKWVFEQGKRVFFLPDQHLGTNTAHDLGLADDKIALYDPHQVDGGLSKQALKKAMMILWQGYCYVHTAFQAENIVKARENEPEVKVIVHPEVPKAVVRLTDSHGSTSQIRSYVDLLPDGTTVYIGTEVHFIEYLASQKKGRLSIKPLVRSICSDMCRTNESNLLNLLKTWSVENEINVPQAFKAPARLALERMMAL